jgi:hypothetical protein
MMRPDFGVKGNPEPRASGRKEHCIGPQGAPWNVWWERLQCSCGVDSLYLRTLMPVGVEKARWRSDLSSAKLIFREFLGAIPLCFSQ